MRILQIISSLDPASGGPIETIKQFSLTLKELGHSVEIVTLDGPDSPWLKESPIKTYALGPGKFKYRYSGKLVAWLKEHAPEFDAVIVRGLWQHSGFGTWQALKDSKIPYFVYPHGMLDPWFKKKYPLKHFKKMLYWLWGEYRVLRDARAVLFTSEEERLLARQSFRRYRCNEVVVNYGTAGPSGDPQIQRRKFFDTFAGLEGKRIILYLSRIHPKKGCDLLIKAFSKVSSRDPELRLVMAGPDQVGWQAKLKSLAQKLNISDKITWTGMLSGELKWGAFRAAEVFILPSHQENFGIAVAEAMACGVPVLISDKVNIWREIQGSGAGFVGSDTLEGTIDLLEKWLTLSYNDRKNMREKAEAYFREHFEIRRAVASLVNALRQNGVKD